MILVKVVQLVVNVDWSSYILLNVDRDCAFAILAFVFTEARALARLGEGLAISSILVLFCDALNLLAHDVKDDSESEEDDSKDTENNHRGAERRHGSPRGQHLLLKLAVLKLIDLLLDAAKLFF